MDAQNSIPGVIGVAGSIFRDTLSDRHSVRDSG